MLPDTGERYLSTPLFADIPADMTADELGIARSTPNYRFDVAAAPSAPAPAAPGTVAADAAAFVEQVIKDREQPVTMFALEWCEFCWSVRRLFAHHGIAIDRGLDSVQYQKDERGAKVRAPLTARTAITTIRRSSSARWWGAAGRVDAYKKGDSGAARAQPRRLRPQAEG
jgi:cysteine synthase A